MHIRMFVALVQWVQLSMAISPFFTLSKNERRKKRKGWSLPRISTALSHRWGSSISANSHQHDREKEKKLTTEQQLLLSHFCSSLPLAWQKLNANLAPVKQFLKLNGLHALKCNLPRLMKMCYTHRSAYRVGLWEAVAGFKLWEPTGLSTGGSLMFADGPGCSWENRDSVG